MPERTADVCVVGAGPAGLTLALLLVRSGVRVVVVERSRGFAREFRGEILQPGALALLDRLGVLGEARARGAYEHHRFRLEDGVRVLLNADYRALPEPYNYLLSIPQRHVLETLLAKCEKYDGFELLSGHRVTELLQDGDRTTGVVAGDEIVNARCVVGADGRYSKVRRLAGIADGRVELFQRDVLWCKIPLGGASPRDVRIFRSGGEPMLSYVSVPDSLQLGWTLPHGQYARVVADGLPALKERICAAAPPYAGLIQETIKSLKDVTLLDVFSGDAPEWVRPGLVLIGDAAHTHSPIGAQGIMLALQDAALLHPILVEAVRRGDVGAAALRPYLARRKDISRVMRLQVAQSGMMLSTRGPKAWIKPKMAALVSRTPIYRKILHQIAYNNPAIRVATEEFTDR
ncbi:FAD-dependent monooxygenase [Nucisporomicrobium flavum]|uniref:FAD-dependent monooxygenase n=1 Tax=Nucisporomicrobium flavum TaxID=2785915 RepID=UPI0018F7A85F|nr:FAD-dependent monooxygenase [Nucisporomicrobium flavum]